MLEQVTEISGRVEPAGYAGKPLVVVLLAVDPAKPDRTDAVVSRAILKKPGPFKFFAGPGTYRISCFEDLNENGSYQSSEPVGWQDEPKVISVAGGHTVSGLSIVLRPAAEVQRLYPEVLDPAVITAPDLSNRFKVGVVTTLDDRNFTRDNGLMTFWEPLRFLELNATGLYFLESFDPGRIPVLFIHGAGGNPSEWRTIINSLDPHRYQAWLVFYPSGLRLDLNRQWISSALTRLQLQLRFTKIHLVAHSMGGLLAGGIVERLTETGHGQMVKTLVTLATPWGGHELAASGVANSPAVVPAWYDMVPGSSYQELLFAHPWPQSLGYYLLFSHRGGFNVMSGGNTDGVVSLKSQLLDEAQDRATFIRGYDEDHTSILESGEAITLLQKILARK